MLRINLLLLIATIGICTPAFGSGSWFQPTRIQSAPGSGYSAPFNLKLMNNKYDCADRFSNLSATLTGNRIDLVYTEGRDTGIVICPLLLMDYGPTFRIPALRNGYYEVYWDFYAPPCAPLDPLCELRAPPVQMGMLSVADDIKWSMQPDTVNAGAPFTLQLLNGAYGRCFTGFGNLNSTVLRSGPIDLSFSIEYYPARMCPADIRPNGPTFQLQGLPPGSYPVYALEQPTCAFDSLPCNPMVPSVVTVDTLVVRSASSILPGRKVRLRMAGAYPLGIIRGYAVNGRRSFRRTESAP